MSNLAKFSNLQLKYKILIIAGAIVTLSLIVGVSKNIIKRKTSSNSFENENTSLAKRLFSALFPEGINSSGSIFNPLGTLLDKVEDAFKDDADINDLMLIANELNSDNFKDVSNAYHKLYDRDLMFDLQNQMEDDFKAFDDKVRRNNSSENPKMHDRVIRTLALNMYADLDGWGVADDELYNQLYQMSDTDFEATVKEFEKVLKENGEEGTFRKWADNTTTMDAYKKINLRLNELGIE